MRPATAIPCSPFCLRKSSTFGALPDRKNGSPRMRAWTALSQQSSSPRMRRPRPAGWPIGKQPPRERWRCSCCSISSRATCSATARAFATDPLARAVADRALAHGFDTAVPHEERVFFRLPFEHSESLADQERSLALSRAANNGKADEWAELHADIIRRFGRFPHRNAVLGRATTAAEQGFLDAGGFAG